MICRRLLDSLESVILSAAIFLIASVVVAVAFERCSHESGGGFCPTGNTCCPSPASVALGAGTSGGCIPSDLGSYNATCCPGDIGSSKSSYPAELQLTQQLTGCGVGYVCSVHDSCVSREGNDDPLVQVLPRYVLGPQTAHPPPLFGSPVRGQEHKLAYYSSHGDVTLLSSNKNNATLIEMVFIVIHGVLRNADDYFCTAMSAVARQKQYRPEAVLVIAPRFASVIDQDVEELANGGTAMRWREYNNGPWRYGDEAAVSNDASPPNDDDSEDDLSLSSYTALDLLLSWLTNNNTSQESKKDHDSLLVLPNLQRVVVAGHSAGGQFVQRWSLLTPIWDSTRFHGVVANPSSFAYLSPLRFLLQNHSWQVPEGCPDYNKWYWGLESGGNFTTPYMRETLQALGGIDKVITRFKTRNITYLAGGQDRCNVSGNLPGWCDSHGMEASFCMDNLEGPNRWERHNNYLDMLRQIGLEPNHMTVPGVGHDHSLMFQSDEGMRAIFGCHTGHCNHVDETSLLHHDSSVE